MNGPVVVMTGGTGGFGALAAERLRLAGAQVLLGGRGSADVALDLASLASVREAAAAVRDRLGDRPIDALVLNAGLIRPDATSRTRDGIETTFAVNHLAHYLLLRLLVPALAGGARVVLTSSGTHDPATRAGLVPPRHADAALLAHPERDSGDVTTRAAGQHAYTASKLCVVLTARELSRLEPRLRVVAYDPGQVFGTGLVRDLAAPQRLTWRLLGRPVLGAPVRRLSPTLNSTTAAGASLADLALGAVSPPPGQGYAALRRGRVSWIEPSVLARDDAVARTLWKDSARLVGFAAVGADPGARYDEAPSLVSWRHQPPMFASTEEAGSTDDPHHRPNLPRPRRRHLRAGVRRWNG